MNEDGRKHHPQKYFTIMGTCEIHHSAAATSKPDPARPGTVTNLETSEATIELVCSLIEKKMTGKRRKN